MGGVAIRPAAEHEMGVVAALFREYAASLGVDLSYQGFEAEVAALPGAYAPPAGSLLLAVPERGEAVGCVAVRPLRDQGVCEIKRLYIRPGARGAGVGEALARAAIDAAMRAGYGSMRLDTLPDMHAAQALYRRLGFKTMTPYYDSPVAGTIFMRKRL